MPEIIIYHNGECSKSKGALELLMERGTPHTVRWYLMEPLGADELTSLLEKLGMEPSALVRKSEPLYKEQYEGKEFTEAEWLDILVEHPALIERPIVEMGDHALVARPPERIYEIIGRPE
jgi:arsenate reductase